MRSPHCVYRNRFIALSICLCALLAFSAPLRADTYQFTPGLGISGLSHYLSGPADGPYGGTLLDLSNGVTLPGSIFFCLTGNASYITPNENDLPGQSSLAPSTIGQEEAAYLYSLMLTDAATNFVILGTNGLSGNQKAVTITGGDQSTFKADLGPIQFAIWYIMDTLPTITGSWNNWGTYETGLLAGKTDPAKLFSGITDPNTKADVLQAYNNYQAFKGTALFKEMVVFTSTSGGQDFIGMVPEPGTMVLFGTGVLLLGLGSTRKLLARRRAR
jgi:hypothetical protein